MGITVVLLGGKLHQILPIPFLRQRLDEIVVPPWAVVDGVQAGQRDTGVRANLIGILSRTYGPQVAAKAATSGSAIPASSRTAATRGRTRVM